jgi:hypothetical protein
MMVGMNHPGQPVVELRCELVHAAGVEEPCPGPPCAFWDAAHGCVVAGLRPEFGANSALVHLLLGLRDALGGRRAPPGSAAGDRRVKGDR